MNAKVTVIAVKDVGPVLGAVSEMASEDKLSVDQVVAAQGFPVRVPQALPVDVPAEELETYAAGGTGPLLHPLGYVVVDGVAMATAKTVTFNSLSVTAIGVKLSTQPAVPVNWKVITRRRTDNVVQPFSGKIAAVIAGGNYTLGVTLRSGETYDAVILVGGYKALVADNKQA
jgi:hypothetical protein